MAKLSGRVVSCGDERAPWGTALGSNVWIQKNRVAKANGESSETCIYVRFTEQGVSTRSSFVKACDTGLCDSL